MDETIITWNATNWITVVLMAAFGWLFIVGALRVVGKGKKGGESG